MKGFIEFIRTQGVVGLAVGFVIGKAVSDLVGSIVTDLIDPIVGIFLGRFGDLSKLSFTVLSANITYGRFISVAINFIIIALVLYWGVTKLGLNKLDKPKEHAE